MEGMRLHTSETTLYKLLNTTHGLRMIDLMCTQHNFAHAIGFHHLIN